jgi:hypothetical protein
VWHDISAELSWRALVEKSVQVSTREPTDAHLQFADPVEESDIDGKRLHFHMCDLFGSTAADVIIVDSTALSYTGLDDEKLFRKLKSPKRENSHLRRCSCRMFDSYIRLWLSSVT